MPLFWPVKTPYFKAAGTIIRALAPIGGRRMVSILLMLWIKRTDRGIAVVADELQWSKVNERLQTRGVLNL